MKIENILCPVDFSEPSRHAAQVAAQLATRLETDLTLLHCLDSAAPYFGWAGGSSLAAATASYIQDARQTAGRALEELKASVEGDGLTVRGHIVDGVAWNEIALASGQADLVVMGTRGTRGPPRILVGSVAERVVRHADCPVVTVPPEATLSKIDKIMVAVDFSEQSDRALDFALELARGLGAELSLLHVVPLLAHAIATPSMADDPTFEQHVLNEVTERLENVAARAREGDVTVQSFVVKGQPGAIIGETAAKREMDLLVVGSHGRTGLRRVMLGSVAERTVRLSPVPVLTYRDTG